MFTTRSIPQLVSEFWAWNPHPPNCRVPFPKPPNSLEKQGPSFALFLGVEQNGLLFSEAPLRLSTGATLTRRANQEPGGQES